MYWCGTDTSQWCKGHASTMLCVYQSVQQTQYSVRHMHDPRSGQKSFRRTGGKHRHDSERAGCWYTPATLTPTGPLVLNERLFRSMKHARTHTPCNTHIETCTQRKVTFLPWKLALPHLERHPYTHTHTHVLLPVMSVGAQYTPSVTSQRKSAVRHSPKTLKEPLIIHRWQTSACLLGQAGKGLGYHRK